MKIQNDEYPIDPPDEILRYIEHGYHVFIGCDDRKTRDSFVDSLQIALDGEIQECIFCGDVSNLRNFATRVVNACQNLVFALGVPSLLRMLSIASSLEEAMEVYSQRSRQGYLILSNMDDVIQMQRTIEVEGPLRSVMQIHDDVAVVIIASNDTIDELVGDYDRPFYMSFRVFRL